MNFVRLGRDHAVLAGLFVLSLLLIAHFFHREDGATGTQAAVSALKLRSQQTSVEPPPSNLEERPSFETHSGSLRMTDGCYSVYVDMGTNRGVQLRKLYEPDLFPRASILPMFEKYFGPLEFRRKSTCALGFEPNPRHRKELSPLQKCYNARGWRTRVIEAGCGTEDGTAVFQSDKQVENNEWSARFNLRASKATTRGMETIVNNSDLSDMTLRLVDAARFVREEVLQRRVPLGVPGWHANEFPVRPAVVMKIDIEGMDGAVLQSLLDGGQLCQVDYLYIEMHVSLEFIEGVRAALDAQGCATFIEILDDEWYHNDVFPLPI